MFASRIDQGRRLGQAILLILDSFKPTAIVLVMIRNAAAHGVGDMAASVGYYGVLAIFPLLIFTITVASFVLDADTVVHEVHLILSQYIPLETNMIDDNVEAIVRSRGAVGIVSLLALAWSASNVFGAMTRFMDRAWGVPHPNAFHLVRAKSLITVASVSVLLFISLGSSTLVHAAEDLTTGGMFNSLSGLIHAGEGFILGATSLLGVFFAGLMLYRWLPSERTPWRYCIPAAFIAGVLLEITKHAFLFYLTNFGSFNAIYGSLSSVVVLLIWIYVTGLVILVVAEFGGALREVSERTKRTYRPV